MLNNYVTAKDVAEILDISLVSANELLDGKIYFEVEEIYAIANAVGVTLEELLK